MARGVPWVSIERPVALSTSRPGGARTAPGPASPSKEELTSLTLRIPRPRRLAGSTGFELLDSAGRVGAALGNIWQRGDYSPGLVVFDRQGHERVSIALHPSGPQMSFALHGNCVLDIGVHDPGPEDGAGGTFVVLATSEGEIVHELHAEERGD